MVAHGLLTTRQVAQRLGVHPQTLRRWEREGVIPAAPRRRGLRVYTRRDVELIEAAVMRPAPTREGRQE